MRRAMLSGVSCAHQARALSMVAAMSVSVFGAEDGGTYGGCARTTGEQAGLRARYRVAGLAAQLPHSLHRQADAVHKAFGEIAAGGVERQLAGGRDEVVE